MSGLRSCHQWGIWGGLQVLLTNVGVFEEPADPGFSLQLLMVCKTNWTEDFPEAA